MHEIEFYSCTVHFFENYSYYYNNRVDVRGHKYAFVPTQTHFCPNAVAMVKMSLRRAKNIFMPNNINCMYYYYNKFKGQ